MTLRKGRHLVCCSKNVWLCVDSRNLAHVFDAENTSINSILSRAAVGRMARWCYELRCYPNLKLQHIPGTENTFADVLSRLHPDRNILKTEEDKYKRDEPSNKICSIQILEDTPEQRVAPITELQDPMPLNKQEAVSLQQKYAPSAAWMLAGNFEFCDAETIAASQQLYESDVENELGIYTRQEQPPHLIVNKEGQAWIPSQDEDLICRIMVVGHSAGHRGYIATMESLKDFYWIDKKKKV